jgi:4-amino-4-deoxy-L-arabinose transferase-like glycosyltransferase
LALLLRVGFVLLVDRPPLPSGGVLSAEAAQGLIDAGLFNDTLFYHRTADMLASGHGFASNPGVPTAQWPPGFPFLLSLAYRVTGPDPLTGELINALLGALTVALLYLLARSLFGRVAGTIAAGALALLPGSILWTDVLLSETLFAFMLVGFFALVAWLPPRPWSVAVLGVAIGLSILTRGEAILLIPALLAVWWPELPRRAWLLRSAAAIGIALLVVAPWSVRNTLALDTFVPLSTNASTTLWSGHNPDATGGQIYASAELLRDVPRSGTAREVEESRLLRREAIDFMLSNPRRELELIPLKLLNLNRGDSWALEWVNPGEAADRPIAADLVTPIRVVADFGYYGLLLATLASLVLCGRLLWRDRVLRGVLVLFAGALVMFGFVYYGNYRYRAPLEPLMLLVAAPLLARLYELRGQLGAPGPPAP